MTREIDEDDLTVGEPKRWAGGLPGVLVSLRRSVEQMGTATTVRTLCLLHQRDGFDCPGCAWPEPREVDGGKRSAAEFWENSVKAVVEEATTRRVEAGVSSRRTPSPTSTLTASTGSGSRAGSPTPSCSAPAPPTTSHPLREISWDGAFALIAAELRALPSPDAAAFYTSGRTSNEAAFCHQLMVRSFGTNNLPDCSNMCHKFSGLALAQTIGVGKGSVSLADLQSAELILVIGQNPGTNHPRMLTALEAAKRGGARIVAVNPLPEAGLLRFKNPQRISGVLGRGTPLAEEFAQVRIGGDLALFHGLGRYPLEAENAAPGTVLDRAFLSHSWPARRRRRCKILARRRVELVTEVIRGDDRILCPCCGPTLRQLPGSRPSSNRVPRSAAPRPSPGCGRRCSTWRCSAGRPSSPPWPRANHTGSLRLSVRVRFVAGKTVSSSARPMSRSRPGRLPRGLLRQSVLPVSEVRHDPKASA